MAVVGQPVAVTVTAKTEKRENVSAETWAAFSSAGVTEAQSGAAEAFEAQVAEEEDALAPEQVSRMLDPDEGEEWETLAVRVGADTQVLEKARLAQALERARTAGSSSAQVALRATTADEQRLLDAEKDTTPLSALTSAAAVPATLLATLAAIGAVYKLEEDVDAPLFLWLAAGGAVAALLLSTASTLFLRASRVRWTRLDALERRNTERVRSETLRVKVPVVIGLIAVALLPLAYLVGDAAPSASIKVPTTKTVDGALTAKLTVKWEHLDDDAATVRTSVTGGSKRVSGTARAKDGEAEQELEVPLAAAGDIEVTTRAYTSADAPLGKGFVQTFAVK